MNSKLIAKKSSVSSSRKTLLIVDDDPSVREMIRRVLADDGYLILTASNGAEALGVAASNHVDLVLLDLNMPGQGGWDTFEKLTAKNPLLAVKINSAKPNQLFTSLGAGVGALLAKPLDYRILLQTIAALLEESGELRLARLTGHQSRLHYVPPTSQESAVRSPSISLPSSRVGPAARLNQ